MIRSAAVVVLALVVGACERESDVPPADTTPAAQTDTLPRTQPGAGGAVAARAPEGGAVVELIDRNGRNVGGARLEPDGDGVRISVRVTGLSGVHGLHFHETGQCDPPAFQSAGSHFAPHGRQHGLENPQGPHAGDLPNIRANAQGVADTTFTTPRVRLDSSAEGLLRQGGTALVVHANADDHRTDPSGNSGDRIACGVVRGG